ncbi:hypothetical protein [Accumulibacter sp.]|uniref:hypothetical protein n=1 Tax=Accumulibacter sp. TaxID=2053492 RepID=UPI0025D1EE37|nr:hypothetical protein [Accumulibacter sp.]MCM8613983.1 hypothetical protein [Accumulibacter sp.]MCM8637754.1 hypothetical protein [Accumulibacter sp.]MCM8638835.1 hypothetical protein [Accumulibacter sp.]
MHEGSLDLALTWDGKRIVAATVVSKRPQVASLLRGLPAAAVSDRVLQLFGICRQAQAAAAALCVRSARGERLAPGALDELALPVALETISEHLCHLLIAWPSLLADPSRPPRVADCGDWRRRLRAAADRRSAAAVAADLVGWLGEADLPSPGDESPHGAVAPLLPLLPAAEWACMELMEDFALRPNLAGEVAETGTLARQAGAAAITRLLAAGRRIEARLRARLLELHSLAAALADPPRLSALLDARPVRADVGLARVETARGTLLHRLDLAGDGVGHYLIVSPTEWNFHPQGPFVREIGGCPADSRRAARFAAERLALSLDPCVPFSCSFVDA